MSSSKLIDTPDIEVRIGWSKVLGYKALGIRKLSKVSDFS